LRLQVIQLPGGKPMPVADFIHGQGRGVRVGETSFIPSPSGRRWS
jgi:hypothetical protein